MTQTDGLAVLVAWATFIGLLALLGWLLVRPTSDPVDQALERDNGSSSPADGSPD